MWWILWLVLAVALLAVELVAAELVSIWFSLASLAVSIIMAIFPELHWGWQIFIFAILSTVLLLLTRPFVRKILKKRSSQETNLELIIGHVGIVADAIDNDLAVGTVKINGLIWSARSENGDRLEQGEFVIVRKIEGNKLVVRKREEKEKN